MPAPPTAALTTWPAGRLAEALRIGEEIITGAGNPVTAATAFRAAMPGLAPSEATALLDQVALRQLARNRYRLEPGAALLTRDGLEQATRPPVARYRAHLLVAAGARRVLDLTAGLGFDSAAFAASGLEVTAVEKDPAIAALCRHNVPNATVLQADATDPEVLFALLSGLAPSDVVFIDPARRDPAAARDLASGRARPERDPERWSPPLSFIESLPHPRVAVKASPVFVAPPTWHCAWTSTDRVVVECAAYSWPVFSSLRRAVIHDDSGPIMLDGDDVDGADSLPLAADVGPWLVEPDPAVTRAGSFAALESQLGCRLQRIDDHSTWLTTTASLADAPQTAARIYRVLEPLTGSTAQKRRTLRARSIDRLVVKSRDVKMDPARVLRDLGCREGTGPVLVLTRRGDRTISLLADPVRAPRD